MLSCAGRINTFDIFGTVLLLRRVIPLVGFRDGCLGSDSGIVHGLDATMAVLSVVVQTNFHAECDNERHASKVRIPPRRTRDRNQVNGITNDMNAITNATP